MGLERGECMQYLNEDDPGGIWEKSRVEKGRGKKEERRGMCDCIK